MNLGRDNILLTNVKRLFDVLFYSYSEPARLFVCRVCSGVDDVSVVIGQGSGSS